jgi:hypothetical protein
MPLIFLVEFVYFKLNPMFVDMPKFALTATCPNSIVVKYALSEIY